MGCSSEWQRCRSFRCCNRRCLLGGRGCSCIPNTGSLPCRYILPSRWRGRRYSFRSRPCSFRCCRRMMIRSELQLRRCRMCTGWRWLRYRWRKWHCRAGSYQQRPYSILRCRRMNHLKDRRWPCRSRSCCSLHRCKCCTGCCSLCKCFLSSTNRCCKRMILSSSTSFHYRSCSCWRYLQNRCYRKRCIQNK